MKRIQYRSILQSSSLIVVSRAAERFLNFGNWTSRASGKNLATTTIVFILFLSIFLPRSLYGQSVNYAERIAERTLGLELVDARSLSPRPWPQGTINITIVHRRITNDESIYELLVGNGIAPDVEALSLVYDLNQHLSNVKDLRSGGMVSLPQISGPPELVREVHAGYLIELAIDPQVRLELNQSIESLSTRAAAFDAIAANRFAAGGADSTKNNVTALTQWFTQIRRSYLHRTGPPLRKESLLGLAAEARTLSILIQHATSGTEQISSADQSQIAWIHDDVALEMVRYTDVLANDTPSADPLIRVVVTIRSTDPEITSNLRIYYTINGIFRDPPTDPPVTSYAFRELGSGKSELLPIKNYRFWAAPDGDPGHPATAPLLVRVNGATPLENVELSVRQGNPQ